MGCDIHMFFQVRDSLESLTWKNIDIDYGQRNYGVFAWLADVRNYSAIIPLSEPRGYPEDFNKHEIYLRCNHSASYFLLSELLDVDYETVIKDRRYTEKVSENYYNRAATAAAGCGTYMTLKSFLGSSWMEFIYKLRDLGLDRNNVRIVFDFDN